MACSSLRIQDLGQQPYLATWEAMRCFTEARTPSTPDELWLVEHPPVFTQGRNGRLEHLLQASDIPVIQTDRGGQITYHGPGQWVIYPLLDLRPRKWRIPYYIYLLEKAIIGFLADYRLRGQRLEGAPGVYLATGPQGELAKIAAIGLRIRRGCTYHGVSFNATNELTPFRLINPCGYPSMPVTRLADLYPELEPSAARQAFLQEVAKVLER